MNVDPEKSTSDEIYWSFWGESPVETVREHPMKSIASIVLFLVGCAAFAALDVKCSPRNPTERGDANKTSLFPRAIE